MIRLKSGLTIVALIMLLTTFGGVVSEILNDFCRRYQSTLERIHGISTKISLNYSLPWHFPKGGGVTFPHSIQKRSDTCYQCYFHPNKRMVYTWFQSLSSRLGMYMRCNYISMWYHEMEYFSNLCSCGNLGVVISIIASQCHITSLEWEYFFPLEFVETFLWLCELVYIIVW